MKPGNKNAVFKPKQNIPFWDQNLNPITMLPGAPNNISSNGIKLYHINKTTNHFVKNYT